MTANRDAVAAGLVEVADPLDLAAEVADGGLGVGLDGEAEGGVDDSAFSLFAGDLDGVVEQGVVDLDGRVRGVF